MNLTAILESQYLAAIKALRHTTDQCPAEFWTDATSGVPFWRATYHALWFTVFYADNDARTDYAPWDGHIDEYQFINPLPWDNNRPPKQGEPVSQQQMQSHYDQAIVAVKRLLPTIDPDEPSPFDWLPFTRMEVQLYNIRHIQHHAAVLSHRLRHHAQVNVAWVKMGSS
jgi:hypothetical protein